MLEEAKVSVPIGIELICQKDSRVLTETDRKKILSACKNSKEDRIVITHGTYTMAETAAYLGPKIKNKTIVLTGSVIPFTGKGSDAMFNLGAAFSAVQLLDHGVYVLMNGKIFYWDNVRKDTKTKRFVEKKANPKKARQY